MGSFRALMLVIATVFGTNLSADPYAEKLDLRRFWAETKLAFSSAETIINKAACALDEESFLGCIHGINAVLSQAKTPLVAVPALLADDTMKYGAHVWDLGPAKIVEAKPPLDAELQGQAKREKLERRALVEAWRAIYAGRTTAPLDFDALLAYAKTHALTPENETLVTAAALNEYFATSIDPHTRLVPTAYLKAEEHSSAQAYVGVGAVFKMRNGKVTVDRPLPDSPAIRAGLRARDIVTAIDGHATAPLKFEESLKLISGSDGTPVKLTIDRKGKAIEITVVRSTIVSRNVEESMLSDTKHSFGLIRLKNFVNEQGCDQMRGAIRRLSARKVSGFILDLRGNPGGLIEQAVCIAGLFLAPNTLVVTTKSLQPRIPDKLSSTKGARSTDLPLLVLIDAESASSSELLAGALQDHRRAYLVGVRSFGKGTVQEPTDSLFGENGTVTLMHTVARFYRPSGRTNQIWGITPDLEMFASPNPTEEELFAEREEDLYTNALPPVGAAWSQPRPAAVDFLKTCAAKTGLAEKTLLARADDAIPGDYQLLYAEDALECLLTDDPALKPKKKRTGD